MPTQPADGDDEDEGHGIESASDGDDGREPRSDDQTGRDEEQLQRPEPLDRLVPAQSSEAGSDARVHGQSR